MGSKTADKPGDAADSVADGRVAVDPSAPAQLPPVLPYVTPQTTRQTIPDSPTARVVYGVLAVGMTLLFGAAAVGGFASVVAVKSGRLSDRLLYFAIFGVFGFIAWVCGVISWSFIFPKQPSENEMERSDRSNPPDDHAR